MVKVAINLKEIEIKVLKKRAGKKLMSIGELIEDMIRKSVLRSKKEKRVVKKRIVRTYSKEI